MGDGWIVIPNWDKFQHYKDRDPVWIKLYLGLNSDPDWLALSTAERGMLTTIWVEYARSRGHLPLWKVRQLCGKSARSRHLDELNHTGFIQVSASKPLALARSREEDGSKREEPLTRKAGKNSDFEKALKPRQAGTNPRAQGTNPRAKGTNPRELARYTGCRWVKGSHSASYVQDPLGTDRPPDDWPYPKPLKDEILIHLEAQDR